MGGEGTIKKKRRLAVLVFAGLILASLVGFAAFRLGRRAGEEEKAGTGESGGKAGEKGAEEKRTEGIEGEGAGAGSGAEFGSGSVAAALCLSDGTPCDFSVEPSPPALISLADRLIPELRKQEQVKAAAAYYRRDHAAVYRGMDGLPDGSVLGIGSDFLEAAGFAVEKGRGLTERDVEEKRRAALMDGRAAQSLFPGRDPVGETIEVEGRLYRVAGVVDLSEPRTGGGLVFIPESTWGEVYQYEEPKSVVLSLAGYGEESFTEAGWEALRKETGDSAARILNSMIPEGEELRYRMQ